MAPNYVTLCRFAALSNTMVDTCTEACITYMYVRKYICSLETVRNENLADIRQGKGIQNLVSLRLGSKVT